MSNPSNFRKHHKPKYLLGIGIMLFAASSFLCVVLISFFSPLPFRPLSLANEIYDIHRQPIVTFYPQYRDPAKLKEIPVFLQHAFIAVEDHRFYHHLGINPGRMIKAAFYNLCHVRIAQGASTITQQLAKNTYLKQERSISRKLKEVFYTFKLEMQYSKPRILEMYLNQIYFGHGAYGIKAAADTYFHKKPAELNQAEMALLAGLPRGPAFYSPYHHPQAARRRLILTLKRMRECGFISFSEYQLYCKQPLTLPGFRPPTSVAPYFCDLLQKELAALLSHDPKLRKTAGLKIDSTLDLQMQEAADQALRNGLPRLYCDLRGVPQPQGAFIAIDPANGEIRALCGGSDFTKTPFNRALTARRQPGSAFKPLLYAAALQNGLTLASAFESTPKAYRVGSLVYRPTDHGTSVYNGYISLREALARSSNVVAVRLLERLGFEPVIRLATELGIHSPLSPQLSIALGSNEVTPLELASTYIPLVNGGLKFPPITIRRIRDGNGRILFQNHSQGSPVLRPGVSFLITQALTDVLQPGGTAANIGPLLNRPAAGKTGTTVGNRDAWFLGYTPDLLACVFVGCDRNERALPGAANRIAAPIWADFITTALRGCPARSFVVPSDVHQVSICQITGMLATESCRCRKEYFLSGTEPRTYCNLHRTIKLQVCSHSGLLPGPNCDALETRTFALKDAPTRICDHCRKKSPIWLFFRRLFH